MRRCFALILLVCVAFFVRAQDVPEGMHQIKLNGHTFTLPKEFTIELAAGAPLTERPITIDFDERGRLYVAESSGSSEKIELQLEKKPHSILRLEDTDGDGKYDKRTVFADQMMFPEGTMWLDGSLYVAAPPSIWKLTDTDDDGVADKREEWFKGNTLTACANDLHGPYAGPDGWIYWAKGAFAKQTYDLPGKKGWTTRASHIFRARPDGSGIEAVMTGGMDNPVDVVFTRTGERIFSCTFLQNPGGGRRDGLIHAIYGGVYGKDHDVVHEHPRTSPELMPVLSHLGPAAPCGLARYESEVFGADYRDNLFTCCFNMRKVVRSVLTPKGASYESQDSDFLVSDHVDFHPTDVQEDADGSLLVVDTGGWYKLCCPTSQFFKPDVLGGIYRVRRMDAKPVSDPCGEKIEWKQLGPATLGNYLYDSRPVVRRRAIDEFARRGDKPNLFMLQRIVETNPETTIRRNAVWAACRIDHPEARECVRIALGDSETSVRQVAAHAASLWRDKKAASLLQKLVTGASLADRRVAAEALGRIGDASAITSILAAIATSPAEVDRELECSLTYALIEIGPNDATKQAARHASPKVRRAAFVALDQMSPSQVDVDDVLRELNASDLALRETAFWIAGRHPEWGEKLSEAFAAQLQNELAPAARTQVASQLAQLAKSQEIQNLLTKSLKDFKTPLENRRLILAVMSQSRLNTSPRDWQHVVAGVMSESGALLDDALQTARALSREKNVSGLNSVLIEVVKDKSRTPVQRLTALSAISETFVLDDELFVVVRQQMSPDQPVASRNLASEVLMKVNLSQDQVMTLCNELAMVGPLEIDSVLRAIVQQTNDEVGLKLVAALETAAPKLGLPVGTLKQRLAKYGPQVQSEAEKLYAKLDAALASQKERLAELASKLKDGDVRRGQAVFHSAKAACAACHAIGYVGGNVGPDLTKIGVIRTERDLLESVLFPSSSFVQGFEPRTVATTDGRIHHGLLRGDSAEGVTLITGANQSVRIPRDEIEEVQLGKVSIMPAGLEKQLTEQELADLLAFLEACR